MREANNKPYKKQYEEVNGVLTGKVLNPIIGVFRNDGSNRKSRRKEKFRFMSNKKGLQMIIHKDVVPQEDGSAIIVVSKFKKVKQFVKSNVVSGTFLRPNKDGERKWHEYEKPILHKERFIEHLVLMPN